MKILILASGAGSTFKNTLEYQLSNRPRWKISGLITDNPKAGALEVARQQGIPFVIVSPKDFYSYDAWGAALSIAIESFSAELIFLLGFLKKIDPATVRKFRNRMVNTHPSLLPRYGGPGMYGRKVHRAVLANGDSETGVSIHLVSEDYDSGPLLGQTKISISKGETEEQLESRVKQIEQKTILEFLNRRADGAKPG